MENVGLDILQGSSHVVLALDSKSNKVIGFTTAISDSVLCSFVSLLEVQPDYQGRGIGQELMRRVLAQLKESYAIDLVCDKELSSFYQKFEMFPSIAMSLRKFENQTGNK
jgi:GNAT superfamily N-acetyltransferase